MDDDQDLLKKMLPYLVNNVFDLRVTPYATSVDKTALMTLMDVIYKSQQREEDIELQTMERLPLEFINLLRMPCFNSRTFVSKIRDEAFLLSFNNFHTLRHTMLRSIGSRSDPTVIGRDHKLRTNVASTLASNIALFIFFYTTSNTFCSFYYYDYKYVNIFLGLHLLFFVTAVVFFFVLLVHHFNGHWQL